VRYDGYIDNYSQSEHYTNVYRRRADLFGSYFISVANYFEQRHYRNLVAGFG
jgi:hypothetical protein